MVFVFLHVIYVFLAIIGTVSIIAGFTVRMHCTRDCRQHLVVLLKDGDSAEAAIRCAADTVDYLNPRIRKVIVIDCGIDNEQREIAEKLIEEFEFVQLVDYRDVDKLIAEESV